MKVSVELEVVPFNVPRVVYVRQEPGKHLNFKTPTEIPLHMLDHLTLQALCQDFTKAVFDAALNPPALPIVTERDHADRG